MKFKDYEAERQRLRDALERSREERHWTVFLRSRPAHVGGRSEGRLQLHVYVDDGRISNVTYEEVETFGLGAGVRTTTVGSLNYVNDVTATAEVLARLAEMVRAVEHWRAGEADELPPSGLWSEKGRMPIAAPRIDQVPVMIDGVAHCTCFHAPEEHRSDGCGIYGCACTVKAPAPSPARGGEEGS